MCYARICLFKLLCSCASAGGANARGQSAKFFPRIPGGLLTAYSVLHVAQGRDKGAGEGKRARMDEFFPRGPDTPTLSYSATDYSSDATDVSSFCDQSEDHEDGLLGPSGRRAGMCNCLVAV